MVDLAFLLGCEHPESDSSKHNDRHVIGDVANSASKSAAEQKADDRHRHLEDRQEKGDPKPFALLRAAGAQRRRDGKRIKSERKNEEQQPQHRQAVFADR